MEFRGMKLYPIVAFLWFWVLNVCTLNNGATSEEFVEMKVVDEPSNFGLAYSYGGAPNPLQDNLKLRVQPTNFSGPSHFKRLIGRCFSSEIQSYRYELCPFSNVTQHEIGIHWNPYHGVLGVWQDWEVRDNKFVAMLMRDGDSCGEIFRSMRVSFICGNTSNIVNVSEPETCNYHMTFMTPLVCHEDSMFVYPTLTSDLQQDWNNLEGEMQRGELTKKGYDRRLRKIFEEAGIVMSQKQLTDLMKQAEQTNEDNTKDGDFGDLSTCQSEYKKLQEEINSLKQQLQVHLSKGEDSSNSTIAEEHQVNSPSNNTV